MQNDTGNQSNAGLASLAWDRLSRAANSVTDTMRVMNVATVDEAGDPQCRLMILRGASQRLGRIWFHTDASSRKVHEIQEQPRICITAYDAEEGVQLRLSGVASIHFNDSLADDHWRQTLLLMEHACGRLRAGERLSFTDPRLESLSRRMASRELAAQRDRFAVIEIDIESFEWHQMRGEDQFCVTMCAANQWEPRSIRKSQL